MAWGNKGQRRVPTMLQEVLFDLFSFSNKATSQPCSGLFSTCLDRLQGDWMNSLFGDVWSTRLRSLVSPKPGSDLLVSNCLPACILPDCSRQVIPTQPSALPQLHWHGSFNSKLERALLRGNVFAHWSFMTTEHRTWGYLRILEETQSVTIISIQPKTCKTWHRQGREHRAECEQTARQGCWGLAHPRGPRGLPDAPRFPTRNENSHGRIDGCAACPHDLEIEANPHLMPEGQLSKILDLINSYSIFVDLWASATVSSYFLQGVPKLLRIRLDVKRLVFNRRLRGQEVQASPARSKTLQAGSVGINDCTQAAEAVTHSSCGWSLCQCSHFCTLLGSLQQCHQLLGC